MNTLIINNKEEYIIHPYEKTDDLIFKFEENKIKFMPLVSNGEYICLISEDEILDYDKSIIDLKDFEEKRHFAPAINKNTTLNQAIKLMVNCKVDLLPIVDISNAYIGFITQSDILQKLSSTYAVSEIGAEIELEIEPRNYSLSEIARICESNDIKILGFDMFPFENEGMILVNLKVNTKDINALIKTFERYAYLIKNIYGQEKAEDDLKERYELFMNYLNV